MTQRNIIRNLLVAFIIYSLLLLVIGRHLTFIPQIKLGGGKQEAVAVNDLRKSVLEKFIREEEGSYSIYYKDLKTGHEWGVDENKVQTGASLNKVPIVAFLYSQASSGEEDLESRITILEEDIQDYGTGSIRYEEPGGSYSLKTLTKLSLEQSDNTAAHVLGVHLGTDRIQEYVDSIGLLATDMADNKISAKDMGKILELIYNGEVADKALTAELLDFMKDTDFEDRLARNLPDGVSVHHKAADGVGFVHDAGIIDDGKNPFILVVMVSEVKSSERAKQTIGKLAEFIYNEQSGK